MPIRHCIVHLIDKKPDGSPAVLHARDSELAASQAMENLLADLNESYNDYLCLAGWENAR